MKNLMAIIFLINITACTTRVIRIVRPAPALREIFRGGNVNGLTNKNGEVNPQGLANNGGHFTNDVSDYNRIEHVCTSSPIYDLQGQYKRTVVKCW